MKIWDKTVNAVATFIGKTEWTTKKVLTPEQLDAIQKKLTEHYYIIATRHSGHLSAYVISFAHLVLTGKMGYYGHVLMNLEDEVEKPGDFRFIEATGEGVHYSGFSQVFDNQTSAVALLKPKSLTLREWTDVMDYAKTQNGKPYDTLFNIADDKALSCVELIRVALQIMPTYDVDFAEFERMIKKSKNLDPQMFYECSDFEVVYEVRH